MRERTRGHARMHTGPVRHGSSRRGWLWFATLALLGFGSVAGPPDTFAEDANSRAGRHQVRLAEIDQSRCRGCQEARRVPEDERTRPAPTRALDRANRKNQILDCVAVIRMSAAIGFASLRAAHQPLRCDLIGKLVRPTMDRAGLARTRTPAPATTKSSSPRPSDVDVAMAGAHRSLRRP